MYRDVVSMNEPGFRQLLELEPDRPFGMLNMLAFRPIALYTPDDPEYGAPEITGEAAFRRYVRENARNPVRAPGGMAWQGQPLASLIAPPAERWDLVFVRTYDTVSSFVEMISSPEYRKARRHRAAAVAASRLIVCAQDDLLSIWAGG